ncbi:lysine transporter LysE [Flexivirga endophytica]|uniref:Lysine transporter LysE n=1 Tax=Flexivirga endophytica TaxID=1849103 RepID=A0A916TBF9_9MICO|nr:LysE family translocator [Flexivirga endophytica]GGB36182.1 lysine transporter LysE [Flexivirga endophytica]GHB43941.1 lysine transporter LysE [Flexivirga endophytica]
MVPFSHLAAFAVTAVVVIAIPGPSVLFTISRALTVGRRSALATVGGNTVGLLGQVIATAVGMGALVEASAIAYSTVKYVGAAYIVWLGVQAIRHRRAMADALARRVPAVSALRAARDGFVVGVMNPKTIVVLVTVMPAYAVPSQGHLPLQMLLLGLLLPLVAVVLDSVWAFAAGSAREWFAGSPRRMATIGGTGGLVMIGLGASIAATGRSD